MAGYFDFADIDLFFNNKWMRDAFKDLNTVIDSFPMDFNSSFPPHNLMTNSDGAIILQLAVAGYDEKSISISAEDGKLIITSIKDKEEKSEGVKVFHKGIRSSTFKVVYPVPSKFNIAGTKAEMKNGILTISIPLMEEKKPDSVSIQINK